MTIFGQWLLEHGISTADAAAELGLSRMAVWRYATGRQRPTDEIKLKIWLYTRGAVEPNDWFDLDPRHLAAPAAADPQPMGAAA